MMLRMKHLHRLYKKALTAIFFSLENIGHRGRDEEKKEGRIRYIRESKHINKLAELTSQTNIRFMKAAISRGRGLLERVVLSSTFS